VLDRNVFQLAVHFAVAGAVMLNFDNYTPDFTVWNVAIVKQGWDRRELAGIVRDAH
jgi:hypothetical protein